MCRIRALNDMPIFQESFKYSEKGGFGNIQHHCMSAELGCGKGIRVFRKKMRGVKDVPLNGTEDIKA